MSEDSSELMKEYNGLYQELLWKNTDWLQLAIDATHTTPLNLKEVEYLLNLTILLTDNPGVLKTTLASLAHFYEQNFETLYSPSYIESQNKNLLFRDKSAKDLWRSLIMLGTPKTNTPEALNLKNRLQKIYEARKAYILNRYPEYTEQYNQFHQAACHHYLHPHGEHITLFRGEHSVSDNKENRRVSDPNISLLKTIAKDLADVEMTPAYIASIIAKHAPPVVLPATDSKESKFIYPFRSNATSSASASTIRPRTDSVFFVFDRDETLINSVTHALLNGDALIHFLQRVSVRPYASWAIASAGSSDLSADDAYHKLCTQQTQIKNPSYARLLRGIYCLINAASSLEGVTLNNPEGKMLVNPFRTACELALNGQPVATDAVGNMTLQCQEPGMSSLTVEIEKNAHINLSFGETIITCDLLTLISKLDTIQKGDYKLFYILSLLDQARLTLDLNDFPELKNFGILSIEAPANYQRVSRGNIIFCDDKVNCVNLANQAGFIGIPADTETAEGYGSHGTYLAELNNHLKRFTVNAAPELREQSLHKDRMILLKKMKQLILKAIDSEEYELRTLSRSQDYTYIDEKGTPQTTKVSRNIVKLLDTLDAINREKITTREGLQSISALLHETTPERFGRISSKRNEHHPEKILYQELLTLLELHHETSPEGFSKTPGPAISSNRI
jgi:hypothetical protein